MADINENPESHKERPIEAPRDSAITSERDQKTVLDMHQQAKDSADTPSGIMKRLTGQESVKLAMIDSADSPSMEAMQALSDPKSLQELELRRGIRQTMEPGPDRDEAERITKEVMRAKEVIPPVEVTVEKGDSLWKIARSHIGKEASNKEIANHVQNIVKENNISNPDLIYPGQRFRLPGYTVEGRIVDQKEKDSPIQVEPEGPEPKPDTKTEPTRPKEETPPELTDKEMFERIASGELEKDPHDEQRKELLLLSTAKEVDTIKLAEGMQNLENRLKTGSITQNELLETYKQVGRIVDGEGSTLLNQAERNALAVQVMDQAGNPKSIDQGLHATCTVTALESRIYTRHPEVAAKLVADVALKGEYTDAQGISIKQSPKTVDPESIEHPMEDNRRSHASEIFQVTSVNLYYERENRASGKGLRYEQRKPGEEKGYDLGEYLIDYSEKPPKYVANQPYLKDEGVVLINQYITGEKSDGILIAQDGKHYGPGNHLSTFRNEEEFQNKLVDLHEKGEFPVLLSVFSYNRPWWSDGGDGSAGGSGEDMKSRHVVSISDLQMGPPITLKVDNQWGAKADHQEGARIFISHDLYAATIEPVDTAKTLESDVSINRKDNTIDAFKEFELLRLKVSAGDLKGEALDKEVSKTVVNEMTKWRQAQKDGVDDDWRRKDELELSMFLVNSMSEESRIRTLVDVNKLGFMPDEVFDEKLLNYGIRADRNPEDLHRQNFRNILTLIPSERASRVITLYMAATR